MRKLTVLLSFALLLLCAGCSRRVVRTVASESVTAAAAASASAEASELRRLSELLTASLSTAAHVTDSVSVHTVERYTVDASGNVTGGTLERTTDRRSVASRAEACERLEAREATDSTSSASSAERAVAVAGVARSERSVEERRLPWWERVLWPLWSCALAAVAVVAVGLGIAYAIRRWRAKRRG